MAGVLCGVSISTSQFHHILLRTEHTGNDDTMQGNTLYIKTVEKSLTNILQEGGGMRYQIGNAGIEFIDVIIGIGADTPVVSLRAILPHNR